MNDLDDEEDSIGSMEKWWNDEEVGSDGSHFSSGKYFFILKLIQFFLLSEKLLSVIENDGKIYVCSR